MTPLVAETPTVSVVITNYNYGHLVSDAVRSALAQTRRPDEILIVDDGSTDDSGAVLRAFSNDARIIFRDHEGVVATRNAAIGMVSTEWLVFLDADDLLLPDFLYRTLAEVRRRDNPHLGFVYTAARTIADGRLGYFPSRRFDPDLLARFNYIANTALVRRSALAPIGYSSEMESVGHEDWDLFLSLVERGWHGVLVARPLFVYRTHSKGRNRESLTEWPVVASTIRRRHPWTIQLPSWRRRAGRRLARFPSAVVQRWWLTVDHLRWVRQD